MKKAIWISLSLITVLLTSAFFTLKNPLLVKPKPTKEIISIDTAQLRTDVTTLCNTKLPRNSENVDVLDSIADYIKQEFGKTAGRVSEQAFEVRGKTYRNVICSFGPENAERIIVGAHYDVCGKQAGADDNATGVAGLLELARLFGKQDDSLKNRIDFVAYTLEEPPYFRSEHMGSAVHARSLKEAGVKVKAMVCLEMIGYFTDKPKSQDYPVGLLKTAYPSTGNFIAIIGKMGQGKLTKSVKRDMIAYGNIPVESLNAPSFVTGVDFSDHLNYWAEGYPAIMITDTSFFRNKNYHQETDTIDTLDFEKMAEVVKGAFGAIRNLAS